MSAGEGSEGIDVEGVARTFERVRKGYDPAAVDAHLARISADLALFLDRIGEGADEPTDLVQRATKRSIDEALQAAHDRADAIIADAEERSRDLDRAARNRNLEMGRLIEKRTADLEALHLQIEQRQAPIRDAATDLRRVAQELSTHRTKARPAALASPIAAMKDDGIEIVLPVDTIKDP